MTSGRELVILGRAALRRGAAVLVAALLVASVPKAPGHVGSRAQLYIDRFRVRPAPVGWLAEVTLIDADSGQAQPGFAVQVTGTSPSGQTFGPVDLADPAQRGRYSAVVQPDAGPWTVMVDAREVPGGPRAIPVSKRFAVTLVSGQTADIASSDIPGGSHRSRSVRLPLVVGALLCGAGAVAALVRPGRRRRCAPSAHTTVC
jgi:hypothetical protein